jgi:phenylpropionate dioxygenase-like ring-hydroxylating dioxygenase large terminal subunit
MYEDLQDRWYVIADAAEVRTGRPLPLRRFGEEIVLWRDAQGRVAGLPDRCPHRGVPLHVGTVQGGDIECPFHGFRFDGRGQCTRMPCEGDDAGLVSRYRTRSFVLREGHGWVWMWRGQPREQYPELPAYFDTVRPGDAFHTTSVVWSTNYIRCIENQLDFTHLPFVHGNTIGKGIAKGRMTVHTRVEGDRIRGWAEDPRDPEGQSGYVELIAPNLWNLRFATHMTNVMAFVPVDETHTQLYMRLYQRVVKVPGLAWLFGWVMNMTNRVILKQDQRVVEPSRPPRPTPDVREMLVPTDAAVIAYRRMLTREAKARRRSLPVVQASARARDGAEPAPLRLERAG